MSRRIPRPYIKPAQKLELNVDYNSHKESILIGLAEFLTAAGFVRAPRRKVKTGGTAEEAPKLESGGAEPRSNRNSVAFLGLRSLFRLFNKSEDAAKRPPLIVLLDADLVRPTAIAHTIALYALGSGSPFFLVPGLSAALCSALNISSASSVAVWEVPESSAVIGSVKAALRPIEVVKRNAGGLNASGASPAFATPQLHTPIGKAAKKKRTKRNKHRL